MLDLRVPEDKAEAIRRYGNPEKWDLVRTAAARPRLTGKPMDGTFRATIDEGTTMTGENNLRVSDELLTRLAAAGEANGKTPEELAEVAIDRLLEHLALDNLAERGRTHAERVGRKPSDSVSAVRDIRRGR